MAAGLHLSGEKGMHSEMSVASEFISNVSTKTKMDPRKVIIDWNPKLGN